MIGAMVAVHIHGRGQVGDGDWEPDDIIEVYEAEKRRNPKTGEPDITFRTGFKKFTSADPFNGWIWFRDWQDSDMLKEFLFVFLPMDTVEDLIIFQGRGQGRCSWRGKVSGQALAAATDRSVNFPVQEAGFTRADITPGPQHRLRDKFIDPKTKIWVIGELGGRSGG